MNRRKFRARRRGRAGIRAVVAIASVVMCFVATMPAHADAQRTFDYTVDPAGSGVPLVNTVHHERMSVVSEPRHDKPGYYECLFYYDDRLAIKSSQNDLRDKIYAFYDNHEWIIADRVLEVDLHNAAASRVTFEQSEQNGQNPDCGANTLPNTIFAGTHARQSFLADWGSAVVTLAAFTALSTFGYLVGADSLQSGWAGAVMGCISAILGQITHDYILNGYLAGWSTYVSRCGIGATTGAYFNKWCTYLGRHQSQVVYAMSDAVRDFFYNGHDGAYQYFAGWWFAGLTHIPAMVAANPDDCPV